MSNYISNVDCNIIIDAETIQDAIDFADHVIEVSGEESPDFEITLELDISKPVNIVELSQGGCRVTFLGVFESDTYFDSDDEAREEMVDAAAFISHNSDNILQSYTGTGISGLGIMVMANTIVTESFDEEAATDTFLAVLERPL